MDWKSGQGFLTTIFLLSVSLFIGLRVLNFRQEPTTGLVAVNGRLRTLSGSDSGAANFERAPASLSQSK